MTTGIAVVIHYHGRNGNASRGWTETSIENWRDKVASLTDEGYEVKWVRQGKKLIKSFGKMCRCSKWSWCR